MHADFQEIVKWVVGTFITVTMAVIGFLGKRAVSRIDDDMKELDERVTELETLKANIMMRPDVLALYADQKEEFREKFKELRQDHKDLRNEISAKLDYVINRLDHRPQNERSTDQ